MNFCIGVNIHNGCPYYLDFGDQSNLLIGGCPGSGKTRFVRLLAYQALRLGHKVIIGDFKGLDFQKFEPKCQVIYNHKELIDTLMFLNDSEIEKRKKLFRSVGAENITDYNKITCKNLKRIFLIIDELGEAMEVVNVNIDKKERKSMEEILDDYTKSLARLGRAYGINLIFGTQRPDVGILQGQTRSQFIYRVCFLADDMTSRIVLNNSIAEKIPYKAKGRCFVREGISYIPVQVYNFEFPLLRILPDMKPEIKVLNNKNAKTKNNIEIVDYDWD